MMSHSAVSMEELLADFESTAERWKAFFAAHPGAESVPTDVARSANIGALVWHIYSASTRHSQRLLGEPVTDFEGITPVKNLEGAWSLQAQAAANLHRYLETVDEENLNTVVTTTTRSAGDVSGSWRKLYLHIMVHAIRHWAQIGTISRQAGFAPNWGQDIFFSPAIR